MAPIYPTHTNQGIDITVTPAGAEGYDRPCAGCATLTETRMIPFGDAVAEERLVHRTSPDGQNLPDGSDIVVIRPLPQVGSPECADYEIRYAQGFPNTLEQSRTIDQIVQSFTCLNGRPK